MVIYVIANAAKQKSFLLHYQAIEDFIRIQIEYLAVKNSIEGLASAAKILSEIYLYQVQYNCPDQESISELYWANEDKDAPNPHPDADLQWDHISNILWDLHQLQKVAIDLRSKYLFEAVKFELDYILFNLRYSRTIKLGIYQEAFIFIEIYSFQMHYALLALENGVFKNSVEAYHFSSHRLSDCIKNEKYFANDLINQLKDYILTCQKNNYLDDSMTVMDLGGLGRAISMEYASNQTVQNEFLSIVQILAELKTEIEKQGNFLENKNYIGIKDELESLKNRLVAMNQTPITGATIAKIDEVLIAY